MVVKRVRPLDAAAYRKGHNPSLGCDRIPISILLTLSFICDRLGGNACFAHGANGRNSILAAKVAPETKNNVIISLETTDFLSVFHWHFSFICDHSGVR
jgi:hypothetical protein